MSELRLKIRNKIYTSNNHIVDTKNNNNAIIVFLGSRASENLKTYIKDFIKDTLNSQISNDKITYVDIDSNERDLMPEKIKNAIESITFNSAAKNKLLISFVTVMDDDLYNSELKIDIESVNKMKSSILGGFSVEFFFDFYGIFLSAADFKNRQNAKKTIINFLNEDNGGKINKRIYHQSCPGNDYYRSAKSISFMILLNLIQKLDQHTVINGVTEGGKYTWTTFFLSEKNLAALVIYEIIRKLLDNQLNGSNENASIEDIKQSISVELKKKTYDIKKLVPKEDFNYIPIPAKKVELSPGLLERIRNIFRKNKQYPTEWKNDWNGSDIQIHDLLSGQEEAIDEYISQTINDDYIDVFFIRLIKMCTCMKSITDNSNNSLIVRSLESVREELEAQKKQTTVNTGKQQDVYNSDYTKLIIDKQIFMLQKMLEYYQQNVNRYIETLQELWNKMNVEVCSLISEFAAFENHFKVSEDLVSDKSIKLMSSYDEILQEIDISKILTSISDNTDIYSNTLKSYFSKIKENCEIVQKFGNTTIAPQPHDIKYYLFSGDEVQCPDELDISVDEYWFRKYEIAILFTAKNNIDECTKLPFEAE